MTEVTANVEQNDIDVAIDRFCQGVKLELCCPVQSALQRQVERVAFVYQASWHLQGLNNAPATEGVALPKPVADWIATFDAWAIEIRRRLRFEVPTPDLAVLKTAVAGRPDAISFTVAVPV